MAKHKYYFTFSCGVNDPHRNGYHIIEAESELAAREIMNSRFNRWAFGYESAEAAGVEEYHLHEVPWPLPEMFTVKMFQGTVLEKTLNAEFRTLKAARIYVLDCAKMLNETRLEQDGDSSGLIRGLVKDPTGTLVWWLNSNNTSKENCIETKLYNLNDEELEHIEFTINAFLKRREKDH